MVTAPAILGAFPEEQFVSCFHQHWLRLLRPFARMLIITALLVAAGWILLGTGTISGDTGQQVTAVLLAAIFTAAQLEFLVKFYHYFLYVVIVTDKRVHRIKRTLLATDEQQSIDLWSLQDIYKQQRGIVQNLLGFGTLVLEAQESVLRIHFIPHIAQRYEEILRHVGKGPTPWQHRSGFSLGSNEHLGSQGDRKRATIDL